MLLCPDFKFLSFWGGGGRGLIAGQIEGPLDPW